MLILLWILVSAFRSPAVGLSRSLSLGVSLSRCLSLSVSVFGCLSLGVCLSVSLSLSRCPSLSCPLHKLTQSNPMCLDNPLSLAHVHSFQTHSQNLRVWDLDPHLPTRAHAGGGHDTQPQAREKARVYPGARGTKLAPCHSDRGTSRTYTYHRGTRR